MFFFVLSFLQRFFVIIFFRAVCAFDVIFNRSIGSKRSAAMIFYLHITNSIAYSNKIHRYCVYIYQHHSGTEMTAICTMHTYITGINIPLRRWMPIKIDPRINFAEKATEENVPACHINRLSAEFMCDICIQN